MKRILLIIALLMIFLCASGFQFMGGKPPSVPADQTFYPTGDDAGEANWDLSEGSDYYALVDETPHDSDTTYIYRQDSNAYEAFTSSISLPAGTILSVKVYVTDYEQAGAVRCGYYLKVNGTKYSGSSTHSSESSWIESSYTWTNNPDTSASWVKEDVEGSGSNPLQSFGVYASSMDASDELRVTQVRLVVVYN